MKFLVTTLLSSLFLLPSVSFSQTMKEDQEIASFVNNLNLYPDKFLDQCEGNGNKTKNLYFYKMEASFQLGDFPVVRRNDEGISIALLCLDNALNSAQMADGKKPYIDYAKKNPDSHFMRLMDLKNIAEEFRDQKESPTSFSGQFPLPKTVKEFESAQTPLEAYYFNQIAKYSKDKNRLQISAYYANSYPSNTMIMEQYYDAILKNNDGFHTEEFYKAVKEGISGNDFKQRGILYYQTLKNYMKKDAIKLRESPSFDQALFNIGAVRYLNSYPSEANTMNAIQNACDYQSKPLYALLVQKAKKDEGLAILMDAPRYAECQKLK